MREKIYPTKGPITLKRQFSKDEQSVGISIAVGIVIGAVIGVLTDNLGLWIALGLAIGSGVRATRAAKGRRG